MNVIRLTKSFQFEMAHALYGYDGPCKNIHGHSYNFKITVVGKVERKNNSSTDGMLIDFSKLKRMIIKLIIKEVDHALMLNNKSPHKRALSNDKLFGKIILVDFQPTCENLLVFFAVKIKAMLPKGVSLHHLYLKETPTSYAEWYASDNVPDKK